MVNRFVTPLVIVLITTEGLSFAGPSGPVNSVSAEIQESASSTFSASAATETDPSASQFLLKCSGCHTIGGGKLTGPDLINAITWPKEELAAAIKKMEKNVGPLQPAEIEGQVELLKDGTVKERLGKEQQRLMARFTAKMEPPSARMGLQIFEGTLPLKNGGMACISCHQVASRGGTFGLDLTRVYERMGELALLSACENTAFKVMRTAYRDHPVTKQEALHLTRYFRDAVDQNLIPSKGFPIGVTGIAVALLSLGGMGVVFRHRETGVRARLVRESSRR